MNGGYVIGNSKEINELFSNISRKQEIFTVSGLYSKMLELYKTGKIAVLTAESTDAATTTFGPITFIYANENLVFTSMASNLISAVVVSKNDSCTAKYISIQ